MKILLLGGTGTMGKGLIEILSKNNNQIFVTSRKSHTDNANVHYVQGNAKDIYFIKDFLTKNKGWDAIVDFMIYSEKEFKERVDSFLTSTNQYVFISSARVYDDSCDLITETTSRLLDTTCDLELLNSENYAITKARQEDVLFNYKKKNWTVIRPYITYSQSKLQLGVQEKEEWLYRAVHDRTIVFPLDLKDKNTTLTYGNDVSVAICSLIGCQSAYGEIFNISSSCSETWGNVLECYIRILQSRGIRPKVKYVKSVSQITDNKFKYMYDRRIDRNISSEKISQIYPTSNFISYNDGLSYCLNQFLNKMEFLPIDWGKQARLDRISGERAKWDEISDKSDKIKYFFVRYFLSERQYKKIKQILTLKK